MTLPRRALCQCLKNEHQNICGVPLQQRACVLFVCVVCVCLFSHHQVGLDPSLSTYGFHAKFNRDQTRILFVVRTRAGDQKGGSSSSGSSSGSSRFLGRLLSGRSWGDAPNGNHVVVMDVNGTNLQRVSGIFGISALLRLGMWGWRSTSCRPTSTHPCAVFLWSHMLVPCWGHVCHGPEMCVHACPEPLSLCGTLLTGDHVELLPPRGVPPDLAPQRL